MKKRALLFILVLSLVMSTLIGCAPEKTDDKGVDIKEPDSEEVVEDEDVDDGDNTIKIGVFEPMTGPSAAGGEMTVEGIKLANEKVSTVLGRKIELVILDNKSEKVEAANAAARLVDKDKVSAIIGSYGSSLSMAAGDIVKNAGVPTVGCSPTNPLVTLNNDYYFRVCFIDPFQGTVMANYAINELGAKTAAIIQDVQQDYSVGLSTYFKKSFKDTKGEDAIVGEASYNTGDQDFTAQLTNIKSLNPDVIFAPGNYGESALLIEQARNLGIDIPMLGGDTWEAPEFMEIGGNAVEGAVYSTHFTSEAPVTEISEVFLDEYKAKYNKDANAFAALGYDAYMLIVEAIEKAGSDNRQEIRDILADTDGFIGATGIITLDINGDAVKSAVINQVKDGEFIYLTTVDPIK